MKATCHLVRVLHFYTLDQGKIIPKELKDYLQYVAITGDNIFTWSSLKYLFHQMLRNALVNFNGDCPPAEIPPCPQNGPFNYERMKNLLQQRIDYFDVTPHNIQRFCELLLEPRKNYSRVDKYMRAVEKSLWGYHETDPEPKRIEIDVLDPTRWNHLEKDLEKLSKSNAEEDSAPSCSSQGGAQKTSHPQSDANEQPKAKKIKKSKKVKKDKKENKDKDKDKKDKDKKEKDKKAMDKNLKDKKEKDKKDMDKNLKDKKDMDKNFKDKKDMDKNLKDKKDMDKNFKGKKDKDKKDKDKNLKDKKDMNKNFKDKKDKDKNFKEKNKICKDKILKDKTYKDKKDKKKGEKPSSSCLYGDIL
ncbi:serine/threonine-protein phosphatase 4 regulatory subunit 2-like [Drosophila subpulchrella]|uniref:serine/threonine-protein phosphatase 4 regulatory subunit 2-like n=1 Tax=Drosophila subpulchrella TaxID=1486046 RepID=UPI0018A1A2BE|nr:serine/threonine-protein phosphatase 4 regulatory subunit 2-like [Drosophila subpulchrella]XP_037725098.1 serine/threonine-protein phosphatase 4 regulatory subunit 2-like [Drosophila subpulchrella]